ncbi:allergen Tha p 1-like [Maniola jurtina]|uniref:allergen Tha p 1-like n=1 Tax=Maniola jurtina TaxID=191418 RepID=UPI001E689892|nr:allergen Tha p 1-like [Maniola jurtina]
MKLLLAVILIASIIHVQAQANKDRFNSVNIYEVLANKRLLTAYIKCVLDKARCTPEGRELKSHITKALQSGCDTCTDGQKEGVRKVIAHLVKHEQDYWKQLVEKYDPEGVYSQKYEDELKELNEDGKISK